VGSNNRTNITHYGGVYGTDSCVYQFKWTAPSSNAGKVTFYAAANAANGDGVTYGDYIYTTSLTLTPSLSASVNDIKTADAKFSIFPNPVADGNAALLYMLNEPANVSAKLLSLNGQVITYFFNEQENAGLHQKKINLNPAIKKGVYLVQLDLNGNSYFKKIEVQ
jgi:hypothetical protein